MTEITSCLCTGEVLQLDEPARSHLRENDVFGGNVVPEAD